MDETTENWSQGSQGSESANNQHDTGDDDDHILQHQAEYVFVMGKETFYAWE